METRVFNNRKELAEALLNNEKWRPDCVPMRLYAFFDQSKENPFRWYNDLVGDYEMTIWDHCDGKTTWVKL